MTLPSLWRSRTSLLSLWVSQSLHLMGNYGLRMLAVLALAAAGGAQRDAAWHFTSALFMLPSVFLVPLYGGLSNALPKRVALIAAESYCAALVFVFAGLDGHWLLCLGLVALGSRLYTPTRYAMLPAAAADTGLPLPRIVSWIEAGAVLSMVVGMIAVGALYTQRWGEDVPAWLPPPAVAFISAVHAVSLLTALPVWFASDVYRPSGAWEALAEFFTDARRVWREPPTRLTLVALATLRAAATAAAGSFIADALARHQGDADAAWKSLVFIAGCSIAGMGVGSFFSGLEADERRGLGMVPLGATGMALTLFWAAWAPPVPLPLCFAVGVFGGMVNVPLLAAYQHHLHADARGNGMALLNTAGYLAVTVASFAMVALTHLALTPVGQLWFVAGLVALGCVAAWRCFGRATGDFLLRTPREPRASPHTTVPAARE